MFIPPNKLKDQFITSSSATKLQLKALHLLIDRSLVAEVFGDALNVVIAFYPDRNALMIAQAEDEVFKKLHKTSQHMLKARNLKGDKSIALHELLIDNQIDEQDRALNYELQRGLGILKVEF